MKDTTLTIRMQSEIKKQLSRLAKSDGRTMSNYIERLIQQDLNQQTV